MLSTLYDERAVADPRQLPARRRGRRRGAAAPALRQLPRPQPRRHVHVDARGQRGDQLRRPSRAEGAAPPRASSPTSSGSSRSSRRGAAAGRSPGCVGMPKPAKGDKLGDVHRDRARRRSWSWAPPVIRPRRTRAPARWSRASPAPACSPSRAPSTPRTAPPAAPASTTWSTRTSSTCVMPPGGHPLLSRVDREPVRPVG